jgi:hypothetical protein
MAHVGPPDMRHAIGYALHWPERRPAGRAARSGADRALTFRAPGRGALAGAALAREVMERGGLAGAVFNAAKERRSMPSSPGASVSRHGRRGRDGSGAVRGARRFTRCPDDSLDASRRRTIWPGRWADEAVARAARQARPRARKQARGDHMDI